MKNLNMTSEKMTVIINLQMMWGKMGLPLKQQDLDELYNRNIDDLRKKQDAVIIAYNKTLQTI